MKRRTEHLVAKRDGRTEFLRATKLARSIHLALCSVGVDEDWRALELANVVLQALRQRRAREAVAPAAAVAKLNPPAVLPPAVLPPAASRPAAVEPPVASSKLVLATSELADAVQHLLVVTGQPAAAVAYGAVAAERSRRRRSLASLGRLPAELGAPPGFAASPAAASLPKLSPNRMPQD